MPEFPKDHMIDVAEYPGSEVGELVKGRPSPQLLVQAVNHVDLGLIMITGEGFCQFASKCLGLLLGYRRDNRHSAMRSAFANDPVPKKDKAVIDVGDMGLLHIQRQLQLAFKELTTFFTNG